MKEEKTQVQTKSAIDSKYAHKTARARGQSTNRKYNALTAELEQKIWRVKTELEIEKRANSETEDFLKRKQAALSKDVQVTLVPLLSAACIMCGGFHRI